MFLGRHFLLIICLMASSYARENNCEIYLSEEKTSSEQDKMQASIRQLIEKMMVEASVNSDIMRFAHAIAEKGFEELDEDSSLGSAGLVYKDLFFNLKRLSTVETWIENFIQSELRELLCVSRVEHRKKGVLIEENRSLFLVKAIMDSERDAEATAKNIKNYKLSEYERVLVAKDAAEKFNRVSGFIQYYGISQIAYLAEIVNIIISKHEDGVDDLARDFKNFGIKDPVYIQELAKIAMASAAFSAHVKDFGISDQDFLVELAKELAAQSGGIHNGVYKQYVNISEHITNYGITDQASLVEIAKIAARQDGVNVSFYIQNYGISDKNQLMEIAKIAAANGRVGMWIKNYGIEDQGFLVQIAKIVAANDGKHISYFIKYYDISDQNDLVAIAKIAAAQNGLKISEYINRYGITDKTQLAEIAKIAAAQDGEGVSLYIQDYGITDQAQLVAIAKIAAAQNGKKVSEFIQNYGINRQSLFIAWFQPENEDPLFEIAKISATQAGSYMMTHLSNYGIKNKKKLNEIKKIVGPYNKLMQIYLDDEDNQ